MIDVRIYCCLHATIVWHESKIFVSSGKCSGFFRNFLQAHLLFLFRDNLILFKISCKGLFWEVFFTWRSNIYGNLEKYIVNLKLLIAWVIFKYICYTSLFSLVTAFYLIFFHVVKIKNALKAILARCWMIWHTAKLYSLILFYFYFLNQQTNYKTWLKGDLTAQFS